MDDPARVQVGQGIEELQEVVLDLPLGEALPPPEEVRHGLNFGGGGDGWYFWYVGAAELDLGERVC